MASNEHHAPATFLRLPQVQARTGMRKTFIYARMRTGDFPAAVKLGARSVVWSSSVIDEWMVEQVRKANAQHGARV